MSGRRVAAGAAVATAALTLIVGLGSGGSAGPAASPASAQPVAAPTDTLAADLLDRLRGLDPVACALATRTIRSRNMWVGDMPSTGNDDARTAEIVAWALEEGGAAAIPVLAGALGDADGCVRRVAAIRLARIDEPAALERLTRSLDAAAPGEREAAALGLGIRGHESAIPALVQRLERDDSAQVRRAAAWALGEIG